MSTQKSNPTKTILIISVGFMIIYLIIQSNWAIYVALIIGLTGILSPWASRKIDYLWMKLSWILSLIIPNILLTVIFYIALFPISILSKLFRKKDFLNLVNNSDSLFKETNRKYSSSSFEKPW